MNLALVRNSFVRNLKIRNSGESAIINTQPINNGNKFHIMQNSLHAGDVSAKDAWKMLSEIPNTTLIDVRTIPEWSFVGEPDLSLISKICIKLSWRVYPQMNINPEFMARLSNMVNDKATNILFLCKSGGRSQEAAAAASAVGYTNCYNIVDGFEGKLDNNNHRSAISGWKAENLPWRQV